ncbi:hypothetical protein B4070_0478 [Bacillus subtilis]|nr:hypothetical protein B4070_0478 [Bacillus subtilis]
MAQKAETPATTTNQKHKGRQPVNKKAIRHISWIAFFWNLLNLCRYCDTISEKGVFANVQDAKLARHRK